MLAAVLVDFRASLIETKLNSYKKSAMGTNFYYAFETDDVDEILGHVIKITDSRSNIH